MYMWNEVIKDASHMEVSCSRMWVMEGGQNADVRSLHCDSRSFECHGRDGTPHLSQYWALKIVDQVIFKSI
jgi:hypothetical protein